MEQVPKGTDREPEEDRGKVAVAAKVAVAEAAVVAAEEVVVEEAAVAVAEEVAAAVVKGWARGWAWAGEWDADSGINFSRPERPHGRKSERK